MSLIFEALKRVEGERNGFNSPPPPDVNDLVRFAELRAAPQAESAPKPPNGEAHLGDQTAPSSFPGPALVTPTVAAPAFASPALVTNEPASPAPAATAPATTVPAASAPATTALAAPAELPSLQFPSGVRRAVALLRAAMPVVERILPLFEGNVDIAAAVSNLLTPPPPPQAPPPAVNLAPIAHTLADLSARQRDLRDSLVEQNAALGLVQDRLELVRDATDRNTLEQQELIKELRDVGNRVNFVSLAALGLAAVSVVLSAIVYLRILKFLP